MREGGDHYGLTAILLHWAMAAALVVQFAIGITMSGLEDQRRAFELIQWHKSLGFLLLGLALVRLGWRLGRGAAREPADLGNGFRRTADFVHGALYALMVALPLTGWLLVSASVLAIPTLLFGTILVPNLPVEVSEASEAFWAWLHRLLGLAGAALVSLHVAAALWHEMTLDRPFLARMLRPAGRSLTRK
jgi:cytochrome b561